jgi:hypothetical protein
MLTWVLATSFYFQSIASGVDLLPTILRFTPVAAIAGALLAKVCHYRPYHMASFAIMGIGISIYYEGSLANASHLESPQPKKNNLYFTHEFCTFSTTTPLVNYRIFNPTTLRLWPGERITINWPRRQQKKSEYRGRSRLIRTLKHQERFRPYEQLLKETAWCGKHCAIELIEGRYHEDYIQDDFKG